MRLSLSTAVGKLRGAALAGALAMAVFGVVEIWFTELLSWVFHRDAFAPLEGGFALALFLLYPLSGAVAAALIAAGARVIRHPLCTRALGSAVVLAIHAAFLTPRFSGGRLVLVGSLNALLLGAAISAAVSPRLGAQLRAFTGPWTVALLLCAPPWIAGDLVSDASRMGRGLSFLATAGAVLAAAGLIERQDVSRRAFVAATSVATIATLAAVSWVGPDPPVQAGAPGAAAPASGPNVLLVVLDTVRADHLSLDGYARDTSPNLRRLARTSTVYTRAIAPSNMTLATHASLFTGLPASQHRAHYDAGRPAGRPLGTGKPTLAEIFVRRGYDVSSVAGNYGFLGKGFGLDRGFSWVDARPRRSTVGTISGDTVRGAFRRLLCRSLRLWPESDMRARSADEITDLAIGRIDRSVSLGRPWFVFVNYFDAHERVLVPPPFDGTFSGAPGRSGSALYDTYLRTLNSTGRVEIPPKAREELVARYDETLAYVDSSLGRLLRRVEEGDLEGNTLVVVTSDHGEAWGEHAAIGHGSSAYQEQVRVPLVVHKPGQREGAIAKTPVGLASLFAFLTGNVAGLPVDPAVVTESFPLVPAPEKATLRTGRALLVGDWKLIRSSRDGSVELYDMVRDPLEEQDLAGRPELAPVLSEMTAALDRWIVEHPPLASEERRESREDRARLRALGYLR